MRKHRKKPQANRKPKAARTRGPEAPDTGRRRFLRLARAAAIALPVVAVAGWFGTRAVQGTIQEADLTRIGQGIPAVVQIHDPACPLCRTLQGQARAALKPYSEDDVTYLVADVNTQPGRLMAATHNVPNVTLLLFDATGRLVQVVRGPTEDETLDAAFAALIEGTG